MSGQINYYPTIDDYKDPVRVERVVRRLYDSLYQLQSRIQELEAAARQQQQMANTKKK